MKLYLPRLKDPLTLKDALFFGTGWIIGDIISGVYSYFVS